MHIINERAIFTMHIIESGLAMLFLAIILCPEALAVILTTCLYPLLLFLTMAVVDS